MDVKLRSPNITGRDVPPDLAVFTMPFNTNKHLKPTKEAARARERSGLQHSPSIPKNDARHEAVCKWVEISYSGVMRPESALSVGVFTALWTHLEEENWSNQSWECWCSSSSTTPQVL